MDFWRQIDIVNVESLRRPISVIGVGGIGSPTVLALSKMGCTKITVYDDDYVEEHNLSSQLYRHSDLHRAKVEALRDIIGMFSDTQLACNKVRVDGRIELQGIVITTVDSMQSRYKIWNESIKLNRKVNLYIDARMGAEVCRILSICPVDPDDVDLYEKSLYSDSEALEEPCTARAIIYNVFMSAALIAGQVKRFAMGGVLPRELVFDFATYTFWVKD